MAGTALAGRIIEDTAKKAADLTARQGNGPLSRDRSGRRGPRHRHLVRMKQNRCRRAGIESPHVALPTATTTGELVAALRELSALHGILLQHPVGEHIDERAAFEAIAPEKDVDGVTFASFATMSFGLPGFVSCTPGGIMRLLDEYDVGPAGKRAVVVGRSAILGKPVGMLLLARDATVTYCHSRTTGLSSVVREADIVVAAVGRPRLVRGEDIKPGAVVIDAGYNPGNVGDVDFDSAVERAGLITPVPGGHRHAAGADRRRRRPAARGVISASRRCTTSRRRP
ncbi:bifunctional 5,10-methylenetetrahydrofolate dehydrogenase/5,10-methenyltetrahydrofolate cyclohydrolase [Streptomyces sp. NPDC002144]